MLFCAFGGGVNSTAVLVGFKERGIVPDVTLFADTRGEKPETYEYIKLVSTLLFPIITVYKNSMYSSLEDECLRRNSLPSLAYGWRSCSDKWKQEPQRKWMNACPQAQEVWKTGGRVIRAIGFAIGEERRVRESTEPKFHNYFPLIEWGWDRQDCIDAIKRAGLPIPIKSACFFCPASKKKEVEHLKIIYPELYARAIAMEKNASLTTIKGLGRSWSWTSISGPEPETIEPNCMCFDGDNE